GLAANLVLGLSDPLIWLHLVGGAAMLLAYLAFGFENFRSLLGQRSTRYGAGAAVYSLLFIALIPGGNYLGHRAHQRWDVTESGVYTLSPHSTKVMQGLTEDLSMFAFVEGGVSPQLESLLESYTYANPSHAKMRMVDPDKEPALVDQGNIKTAPSVWL